MLNIYDLYDLHAILTRIRFSPETPANYEIISRVIDVLTNKSINDAPNQFRLVLREIDELKNDDLYDFVYVENKYSYYPLSPLKDENIYYVLISALEELLDTISRKSKEQISDLADCLHNLPIFIVENELNIPKQFWKNEVKYYRKKWNKSFLLYEQKLV